MSISTIDDLHKAALADLGFTHPGLADAYHAFLSDATGLDSNDYSLADLENEWLIDLGYTYGTNQDRLSRYLTGLGYTGDINTQRLAWYSNFMPTALVIDAVDFDGTNDYMVRGADLTGILDGKTGTLSLWVRFDGSDGIGTRIIHNNTAIATSTLSVQKGAANLITVTGRNSSASVILLLTSASTYLASSSYIHILSSWNLATGAGHFYVNDVSDLAATPTLTNDTIDYTIGNFSVGALSAGGNGGGTRLNGALAEVWFDTTYLDVTVEANRRKFILENGKPSNLLADGSGPTGASPLLYLSVVEDEAATTFATNKGTGGDFTITGALDIASTSPSD